MTGTIEARCRCGSVRGVVEGLGPGRCTHATCYCADCRTFARFLGRDDILDEHGGTRIVQTAPAHVRFESGREHIACVRLSPKGLFRWYAQCCRTPLGNTVSAKVPFVGLPRMCIDDAIRVRGHAVEDLLGPLDQVWGREALGGCPPGAPAKARFGTIARSVRLLFGWWVRGKGRPSPFFDDHTGAPRVEPTVLPLEERKRLRELGVQI